MKLTGLHEVISTYKMCVPDFFILVTQGQVNFVSSQNDREI